MSGRRVVEFRRHPEPEELMAYLDGESGEREAQFVAKHLRECAECRQRLEGFAETSDLFSATRVEQALVHAAARGARAERPLFSTLIARSRSVAIPRSAAASIAVLLSMSMVAHLLLSPRPVSARGVVRQAQQREQTIQQMYPLATVQRELRATKAEAAGPVRSELWVAERRAGAEREELVKGGAIAHEVQVAIAEEDCRAWLPHSLEMLGCLLDAEPLRVAVEEREGSGGGAGYAIQVASVGRGGDWLESQWLIDRANERLRHVEYRLGTGARSTIYRIEETERRIVPFVPRDADEDSLPVLSSIPRQAPRQPSVASLAAAKSRGSALLEAYEAIAAYGLEVEDDLRVEFTEGEAVRLSGTVATPERRRQLAAIAAEHSGLTLAVFTQEEAVAKVMQTAPLLTEAAVTEAVAPMRSEGPLFAERLAAQFGDDEEGAELALRFGSAVLEHAQRLTFESHWVQRLDEDFGPAIRAEMSAEELARLAALRDRWMAGIAERHQELGRHVLSAFCNDGCAGSAESESDAERLPWLAELDGELALLKALFVDRGYLPSLRAEDAFGRWRVRHSAISQDLKPGAASGTQEVLALTAP